MTHIWAKSINSMAHFKALLPMPIKGFLRIVRTGSHLPKWEGIVSGIGIGIVEPLPRKQGIHSLLLWPKWTVIHDSCFCWIVPSLNFVVVGGCVAATKFHIACPGVYGRLWRDHHDGSCLSSSDQNHRETGRIEGISMLFWPKVSGLYFHATSDCSTSLLTILIRSLLNRKFRGTSNLNSDRNPLRPPRGQISEKTAVTSTSSLNVSLGRGRLGMNRS